MWLNCYSDSDSATLKNVTHDRIINSDYIKEIFIYGEKIEGEMCFFVCVRACDLGVLRAQPMFEPEPYIKNSPQLLRKYNPYIEYNVQELYILENFKTSQDARKYLDDLLKKLNESR